MPHVRRFTTAAAGEVLLSEIRRLLDAAFEGEFSDEDWEHTVGGWHVVADDAGAVVSHAAVVPRVLEVGGRPLRTGYVEGVVTAPGRRHEGLGTLVVTGVSDIVRADFEIGALSTGAYELYARAGWERWRGPTFVRSGPELIRTEEEDDGLMVLRFGASADVDLAAPISCDARPGDDW